MPGAMPRGYSFRSKSERTLDQKSISQDTTTTEDQLSEHEGWSTTKQDEFLVDLPSEGDYYDTPYRDDYKEIIGAGTSQKKSKKKSKTTTSYLKKNKAFQHHHRIKEEEEDDGEHEPSDEYECESVPIVEASYVADASHVATAPMISSAHHNHEDFVSDQPTIALFGATGITGGHFLTAALDAGYYVRCTPADDPREVGEPSGWEAIQQSLEDPEQIRDVIFQVDYVVVMLNEVIPGKQAYPSGFLASFVERLYGLLREEPTVQVVLFQVRGETQSLLFSS